MNCPRPLAGSGARCPLISAKPRHHRVRLRQRAESWLSRFFW
jgi:hypothetical protein